MIAVIQSGYASLEPAPRRSHQGGGDFTSCPYMPRENFIWSHGKQNEGSMALHTKVCLLVMGPLMSAVGAGRRAAGGAARRGGTLLLSYFWQSRQLLL
ncbi:unnamed protein product, partial [Brenthis ino]